MPGFARFHGLDGCRAGWFHVTLNQSASLSYGITTDLATYLAGLNAKDLVLIDIPIGLPDAGPEPRRCDQEARRLLGAKSSSVFPPPCRAALTAPDYPSANQINREQTTKGLQKQTYFILPKIREADTALDRAPTCVLRESHPEVVFQSLNRNEGLGSSKKDPDGQQQRLQILKRYLPGINSNYETILAAYKRKDLARDDVLDAIALAVAGKESGGSLKSLPERPDHDSRGRPMEIVYHLP